MEQKYLSLYYNDNDWSKIIDLLLSLFGTQHKNGNLLVYIAFSHSKGPHLDIIYKDTTGEITGKLQNYVSMHKSDEPEDLWKGKRIWMPYSNNSILYNSFRIPPYLNKELKHLRELHITISNLILELYDKEYSFEENRDTILMYFTHIIVAELSFKNIIGGEDNKQLPKPIYPAELHNRIEKIVNSIKIDLRSVKRLKRAILSTFKSSTDFYEYFPFVLLILLSQFGLSQVSAQKPYKLLWDYIGYQIRKMHKGSNINLNY
ncbi:MAG: hypothetical protein IKV80_05665 [Bacteroidales bacterium]|nr:hypothetical protein [Bacteroidales bacterium]